MKSLKLLLRKLPLQLFLYSILILFLISIVFLFGVNFKQKFPTKNSTNSSLSGSKTISDWETYISDTYQFSFQYPKDWVLKEATNPSFWVCASCESYGGPTKPDVICDPDFNLGSICISMSNAKNFDEIVSNKLYADSERGSFLGNEAVRVVQPGGPSAGGSYLITFIARKMRIYDTDLTRIYEINLIYKDLFNTEKLSDFPDPKPNILSTFRFLE